MSLPVKPLGMGAFALRVAARPGRGGWLVLVAPDGTVDVAASDLVEELSILQDTAVEHVQPPEGAQALAKTSKQARESILVASGFENFSEAEWTHLDLLRSQLQRELVAVLVLTQSSVERLMRAAPNLASWLAGSIWQLAPNADSLTPQEREHRLEALRYWSGKTDDEVIALAQSRRLPAEPEYAEWLVLLNRGDLL